MIRILATTLSILAFLASGIATINRFKAPLYQGFETRCTESRCESIQVTQILVEANGPWVVYQLVLVTLVSGVPLFFALWRSASQRLVTWVPVLLLLTYSIAGSFTIGLVFMPSAILLLIAWVFTAFICGRSIAKLRTSLGRILVESDSDLANAYNLSNRYS